MRETGIWLGCQLTTLEYRHVVATIGRQFIGAVFGYRADQGAEEDGDIEAQELEVELDSPLEAQAGRTELMGAQVYGVRLDLLRHVSARSLQVFGRISAQWHAFLDLPSQKPKAKLKPTSPHVPKGKQGQDKASCEERSAGALAGSHLRIGVHAVPYHPYTVGSTGTTHGAEQKEPTWLMIQDALSRVLGQPTVSFKSKEQEIGLRAVAAGESPLVIVLPTGGGKSLLFLVPACLADPGTTIVVVPFRELVNRLKSQLQALNIQHVEWADGEQRTPPIVVVSADVAGS